MNPNTHTEVILQLLNSATATVRRRAALHPTLSDEILDGLIRNGPEATRAAVVLNANLSDETTRTAARDASPAVRAALASNPRIPVEVLSQLAGDVDPGVRAEVAANPATPSETVTMLARDEEVGVRAAAAENPQVDRGILRAMSTDSDPRVCAALARNPACPPKVLRELLEIVPHLVLANPNTPRSLLTAGARATDPELRAQVARNPSTPSNILETLAADGDLDVVHAVAYRSAAPKRARKQARSRLDDIYETDTDLDTSAELGDFGPSATSFSEAVDPFAVSTTPPPHQNVKADTPGPDNDPYLTPETEPADDHLQPVPLDWQSEAPEPDDTTEYVDPFAAFPLDFPETDAVIVDWQPDSGAAGDRAAPDEPESGRTSEADRWLSHDETEEPEASPAAQHPPLPTWPSPNALIPEILDAIDAALSILRRAIDRGDGAIRRLTKTPSTDDPNTADNITALAARLQAIAEHTTRAQAQDLDRLAPGGAKPKSDNSELHPPEPPGRPQNPSSRRGAFTD